MDAVIGQNCVDFIRNGFYQREEESRRRDTISFLGELGKRELRGAVYGDEKIELSGALIAN